MKLLTLAAIFATTALTVNIDIEGVPYGEDCYGNPHPSSLLSSIFYLLSKLMFQSLTTVSDATYAQQDMLTAATAALTYVRYLGSDSCPLPTFRHRRLVFPLETSLLALGP